MNLSSFKKTIAKKFESTVKIITNKAIPIAQKEAKKVIQTTSSKKVEEIIDIIKLVAIGGVIVSMMTTQTVAKVASEPVLDGISTLMVNIENLTINM